MIFSRRAWGWYLTLLSGKHFKVKLLFFRRGGRLSFQHHTQRSEIWLFLSGKGKFYLDERGGDVDVVAGDSHIVLAFWKHQYTAQTPTIVLEIQHGNECREDDIERFVR